MQTVIIKNYIVILPIWEISPICPHVEKKKEEIRQSIMTKSLIQIEN